MNSILIFDVETTGLLQGARSGHRAGRAVGHGAAGSPPDVAVPAFGSHRPRCRSGSTASAWTSWPGSRPSQPRRIASIGSLAAPPCWSATTWPSTWRCFRPSSSGPGWRRLAVESKRVIDPYRLWQKMEPRGLLHAHRRFAGGGFDGAHRAGSDVAATAAVLAGMIAAFGLETEWPALAELCRREGSVMTKDPRQERGRLLAQAQEQADQARRGSPVVRAHRTTAGGYLVNVATGDVLLPRLSSSTRRSASTSGRWNWCGAGAATGPNRRAPWPRPSRRKCRRRPSWAA